MWKYDEIPTIYSSINQGRSEYILINIPNFGIYMKHRAYIVTDVLIKKMNALNMFDRF